MFASIFLEDFCVYISEVLVYSFPFCRVAIGNKYNIPVQGLTLTLNQAKDLAHQSYNHKSLSHYYLQMEISTRMSLYLFARRDLPVRQNPRLGMISTSYQTNTGSQLLFGWRLRSTELEEAEADESLLWVSILEPAALRLTVGTALPREPSHLNLLARCCLS